MKKDVKWNSNGYRLAGFLKACHLTATTTLASCLHPTNTWALPGSNTYTTKIDDVLIRIDDIARVACDYGAFDHVYIRRQGTEGDRKALQLRICRPTLKHKFTQGNATKIPKFDKHLNKQWLIYHDWCMMNDEQKTIAQHNDEIKDAIAIILELRRIYLSKLEAQGSDVLLVL